MSATATEAPPQVADGVQLLGEYAGSGFKEPPALARRRDGQVIQLPPLLYDVLRRADGQHTPDDIAAEVSEDIGRRLSGDDVEFLVAEKLRPMGLVTGPDGSGPPAPTATPFLGLKFRTAVISEPITWVLARVFSPLFFPVIVVAAIAGLVALDYWLFALHGVAQPIRQTLIHPQLILLMIGIVVVSAAFHEVGHAAACAYGGARPGRMGCGLYLAWPAFYTDVTDSYRLDRRGRLRTDLGGVYFNTLFILALAGVFFATQSEPLLLGVVAIHFEIAHQLIPVIRLDGYYIVSDLTGVPDLFARIGPILRSAVPGRPVDERVTALKPWVRWAVAGWVIVLLPVIGAELVLVLMNLPRIYGTGAKEAHHLVTQISSSASHGHALAASANGLELVVLLIPLVGIILMLARAGLATFRFTRTATAGHPVRRAAAIALGGGALALLAYAWIPPSNYKPITPYERGTLTSADVSFGERITDPSWTPGVSPPTTNPNPAVSPSATLSPSSRSTGATPTTSPTVSTSATTTPSATSSTASPSTTSTATTTSPTP